MSKIPQGEWNAIAARYAKGESISRIAQSYGCTPPAIHYILKRNAQRAAKGLEQTLNGQSNPPPPFTRHTAQMTAGAGISRAAGPTSEDHASQRLVPDQSRAIAGQSAELRARPYREIAPVSPTQSSRSQSAVPQPQLENSRNIGRSSALTAGLDRELHGRAEAAIEAFRSSFDAALVEGSPVVRQRLRQAASDLMRVAARTTIVLDRLSASAERASHQTPDHLRARGHA
jgi:hypothetical protein